MKNFEFGHGKSETRSHRVLLIFRRFSFGVASRTLQRIILGPFHCVLGAFFFSSKKNTHTQQNNQCDAVVPRHVPTHRLRCCVRNSILLTVHRRSRRRKTIPSFEFRTFTEFFLLVLSTRFLYRSSIVAPESGAVSGGVGWVGGEGVTRMCPDVPGRARTCPDVFGHVSFTLPAHLHIHQPLNPPPPS